MDETVTISVATQIKCLNFIAGALHDRLLGFHVAQSEDLRQIGTLYYIVASSEFLGEALQRAARYTVIVNEGIGFDVTAGKLLKVSFESIPGSRGSRRPSQIEAWMTL